VLRECKRAHDVESLRAVTRVRCSDRHRRRTLASDTAVSDRKLVIALAGAALGALAAWYGTPALFHFFRDRMMFESISVRLDRMVFWATGLCAIGTTLLFGTLPSAERHLTK
jgi:hypothetical protein